MDIVKYTAQLDLTDNGCFDTGWRIKQGDYGNSQLMISLVDNGVNAFDSNVIPQINFKRPDGKSVLANMTVEQNVYSYIFAGNELELAGTVLMDVKFITPQGRTSSASCKFTCVEDTIGIDTTGAGTYYNPVSEVIEEAKAIVEEAGGYAEAVADLQQNKQNKLIAGRNITIDEETNVISASGGGGGGGSSVIANPTLSGEEADLTALEVDGTKYKVSGGGGNADKVELTKAEYDALPESKLTDGKMYFITDWNEGTNGYNITTDEIETGRKFFDKKTYIRAYNFPSNISTQGTNVGTSTIPNLNEMASVVNAVMIKKDGRAWSPLAVYMSSGNLSIRTQYNTTGASDIYIVLEYTKVGE